MRPLDGKPLIVRTLERARECFPLVPIRIAAPQFDRGGLDIVAASIDNCRVDYMFDDNPLKRMVAATRDLRGDDTVLRLDGQHCFFQENIIGGLLYAVQGDELDLAKSPDDYPPPLTGEVWRVSALRHIEHMLGTWPKNAAAPHNVHPKFLAMRSAAGLTTRIVEPPPVSDDQLTHIRAELGRAFDHDHIEVTKKSIAAGDQISFHYVLAKRHLSPGEHVLDVASGKGVGGSLLADTASSVVCADLDEGKLEEGRKLFPRANLAFSREDVMNLSFPDASFDVVVSMETIEHMDDVDGYLAELRRVLKPLGKAVLSTPQNRMGHIPLTPAHVHEFSLDELRYCCRRHFKIEKVIGLKAGTIYFEDDPVGANSMIFLRAS